METKNYPDAANDGAFEKQKIQMNYNSRKNQRLRLIAGLNEAGAQGLSTIEIRENLGIIHPGGRIHELRCDGYGIVSRMELTSDSLGHKHKVARYFLVSYPQQKAGDKEVVAQ